MTSFGKILIADDEETFLLSTAAILSASGYACEAVSDGISAANKLRANFYDILVVDFKMPGNMELELIKLAPQIAPGMPVIMVMGVPFWETETHKLNLPVVAYLVKPVDMEKLLTLIRTAVEYTRSFRVASGAALQSHEWHEQLNRLRQLLNAVTVDTALSIQPFNTAHSAATSE